MVGMASAGAVLSPSPPQSRAADAAVLPAPPSTKLAFEERVQEFTLPNGLHFIVLPRATAPVVSVHVYADVGAFQEKEGATGAFAGSAQRAAHVVLLLGRAVVDTRLAHLSCEATGLAHLLEHMAFKGTRRVGARDWPREAALLDAMDDGAGGLVCRVHSAPSQSSTGECCLCTLLPARSLLRDAGRQGAGQAAGPDA